MGTKSRDFNSLNPDCFNQGNQLDLNQKLMLLKPFSHKEIKRAMFSIPDSKSPGPVALDQVFSRLVGLKLVLKSVG